MVNQSHKLSGPFLIELKNKFREIAGSDNKIDRQEFKNSLVIENEKIINRIFDIFDKDENNFLDINEFINGIETLIKSTNAQKIKFAFDIHDFDGSGDIDKDELKILIKNILIENNLDFDANQVDLIVDEFFRYVDVDKNGRIDFNEFLNLIKKYPELINSLAANPTAWFRNNKSRKDYQTNKKVVSNTSRVQVQNLNVLQWLLVPRLIYFYNIIINRNKNNELISIKSLKVLPEKNILLSFDKPSWFKFQAGDYVYINCPWVSRLQWYPFNIISPTNDKSVLLNIKAEGVWPEKIYNKTISMLSDKNVENLKIKIDGPFGSSSDKILQCENLIIIAEDKGVAKFASVLQDINHRTKKNQIHSKVKTLNFIWLCSEGNYFEWFKKMLQELDKNFDLDNFKYSIYFLDRNASDLPKDMLYVSKDVFKKEFKINLLPGVKSRYHIGTPSLQNKLSEIISEIDNGNFDLFFSGSRKVKSKIKSACKELNIKFNNS
jgi:Ca2+-binding EF-hand superfamily protein/NAD(P)H-flavin reductase